MIAKQNRRLRLRSLLLLSALGLASFGRAIAVAPHNTMFRADKPELTKLFPFGGKTGTVVEVEATGKFPVWPMQVWSDTDSIQWSVEESSGKLKATINADARPGLHWMRLHHANGATAARAFLVNHQNVQIESEPNNRLSSANAIASIPASVQGVLHKRGEVDIFSVELKAGQKLFATVDAERTLHSPFDATLQLLDAEGFLLDESMDHYGLDPSIEWVAAKDGKYFLRLFGFPSAPDQTIAFGGGDNWIYRLRLESTKGSMNMEPAGLSLPPECKTNVIEDGQATSRETSIALELPCAVTGKIGRDGEHKFLSFQANSGQHYRIRLQAREQGSELDATVALLDSNGKLLVQQDDIGEQRDPDLKWKAPADGQYFLDIQDFHRLGGARFDFELLVSPVTPDYQLSISNDLIQVNLSKETEVDVAINREYEFAGEITVSLSGAPEGVECAAVASISSNETAKKVTLRIKSTVPFQGPVSVIAKTKEPEDRVRTATAEHGKPIWLSCVAE